MPDRIVVIAGPTAVGKTDIALHIAKKFDMEILSCDSMQLYKYMDIGSAKPTKEEQKMVPHHMIDAVNPLDFAMKGGKLNPNQFFNVVKYSEMARKDLSDIISRGKIPLIVGGTGLYLDALLYDIDFASEPYDDDKRNELYTIAEEEGPEALHKLLIEIDPEGAERIHPNNIKRVVRAIEAARSGKKVENFDREFKLREEYAPILIGLTRDREELYDRINRRVDILMERGLLDEVVSLKEMGLSSTDYPMKGIGYKELMEYLDGETELAEAVEKIKTNSRHYAKRQFTWFRKYEDMHWFDLTGVESDSDMLDASERIEEWLTTKL